MNLSRIHFFNYIHKNINLHKNPQFTNKFDAHHFISKYGI